MKFKQYSISLRSYFCFILLTCSFSSYAQVDTCINTAIKHTIQSTYLNEQREFWVSLPMGYDSAQKYPVMYVLDAEWRFEPVRNIAYDMAGNKRIPHHIIVGIPHINWEYKRGIDLTFSQSRIEYDGDPVDSTWYNSGNSGGGSKFFQYFDQELIAEIDQNYSTSGSNILIGHSYGGYFGGYILTLAHQFSAIQMYDPSIWFSNGEVTNRINTNPESAINTNIFISFQDDPAFHYKKIHELINLLDNRNGVTLGYKEYKDETHNSLYLYSFIDGMKFLYPKN